MVNLEIGPLPQHLFLEQVYRMPLLVQLAPLLPSLTKSPFFLGTTRFVVASFMSVPHCQSLAEPVHSCLGCEWALTALLITALFCVHHCWCSTQHLGASWQRVMQPPRDGAQLLLVRKLIQVSPGSRLKGRIIQDMTCSPSPCHRSTVFCSPLC